jgi:hypothetical protein
MGATPNWVRRWLKAEAASHLALQMDADGLLAFDQLSPHLWHPPISKQAEAEDEVHQGLHIDLLLALLPRLAVREDCVDQRRRQHGGDQGPTQLMTDLAFDQGVSYSRNRHETTPCGSVDFF